MRSVLIIDDETVSHEYIRSLVHWEDEGLKCCPPAYGGEDARLIMKEQKPDIVLLDMSMPGENGVDLSRYILNEYPKTVILAISSHDDYDYVREVLKNGAYDYILKHRLNEELLLEILRDITTKLEDRASQRILPVDRPLNSEQIIGMQKMPSHNGDPALGIGITLPVSQRKILSSLLEEGNRPGTELIIRDIFSSVNHESGIPGIVYDLARILEDYLKEKGINVDFLRLVEWAQEKSLPETEQKILEMLRESVDEIDNVFSEDNHIRQVRRYLLDHYFENISLEDVAAVFNFSASHLSRLYHKETGISFSKDLNRIRVDAAKACLLKGINLKSTASRCGFRLYNYFIKVFHDYTGLTPLEYIKNL